MGLQVTRAEIEMDEYYIQTTKATQTDCKNKQEFQYPVSQNEYSQFQIPAYTFALVTSFSSAIFLIGVIGNLIVMFIILRNRDMRNATNMCLLSLSAADMLVLCVCMPSALVEFYGKDVWYLGDTLCKIIPFIENTAVNASAITILAISVERFYAICRPLKVRIVWTYEGTAKVIAVLWTFAAVFTIPFVVMSTYSDAIFYDGSKVKVCSIQVRKTWHKIYVITTVCLFFILPFCALFCIYFHIGRRVLRQTRQNKHSTNPRTALSMKLRKQVVLMLIIVTAIFFFCLTPFKIVSLWVVFVPVKTLNDFGLENYLNLLWFARIMYYVNSSTNPIVYDLVSTRFRNYFRRAVPCNILPGTHVSAIWTQTTPINGQSRKFTHPGTAASGSSSYYESRESRDSHSSRNSRGSRSSKDISLVVIKQKDMILCATEKRSERKLKKSLRDSQKSYDKKSQSV